MPFENGEVVESVEFQYPDDLPADDHQQSRKGGSEAALAILRLLTAGNAKPTRIGQRAVLLLYAMGRGDFKNQAAVARRLKVTRQAVAQMLDILKRDIPSVYRGF